MADISPTDSPNQNPDYDNEGERDTTQFNQEEEDDDDNSDYQALVTEEERLHLEQIMNARIQQSMVSLLRTSLIQHDEEEEEEALEGGQEGTS